MLQIIKSLNSITEYDSNRHNTHFIVETTLGLDIKTQTQENPEFLHTAHRILDITSRRFFQPWIQPKILFWLSKYHNIFHKSVNALNTLLRDVILLFFVSRGLISSFI